MSHTQEVTVATIILMILLSAIVGGLVWAWQLFWNAYDNKWKRIPPTGSSRYAGQHTPRAARGSQTRGHV